MLPNEAVAFKVEVDALLHFAILVRVSDALKEKRAQKTREVPTRNGQTCKVRLLRIMEAGPFASLGNGVLSYLVDELVGKLQHGDLLYSLW